MQINIINVIAVIDYIENNLSKKLDLEIIANALHYSKYHLHRVFKDTVSLTIHEYIRRRRLSEAAKLLVFSDKSIIDIAFLAGYESQQAFTSTFTSMYKKSPNQYRTAKVFYPLQLRYTLNKQPTKTASFFEWRNDIVLAKKEDIPAWIEFLSLVVDGFPYLNEVEYQTQLKQAIHAHQAMMIKDQNHIIGAMIFNKKTGSIDFLGIHPQYRKRDITIAFIQRAFIEVQKDTPIYITTFREGDKADLGYRKVLLELGFLKAELLTEFGYPTQRLSLHKQDFEENEDV